MVVVAHLTAAERQAADRDAQMPERFANAQRRRPKVVDISGGQSVAREVQEQPEELLQRTIEAIANATFTGKVRATRVERAPLRKCVLSHPALSIPMRIAQGDKPVVQRMLYELEWYINVAIESAQADALSVAIDPLLHRARQRASRLLSRLSLSIRLSESSSARASDSWARFSGGRERSANSQGSDPRGASSPRPHRCVAVAPADPPSTAVVAVAPRLPQSHSSDEETLCEASATAERQQDAEDIFILADTSGDGVVDEDELCVLCATLMARQGQPQSVSDEALRNYLRTFRASPSTPLRLDFDEFAGVYNSFLVAQHNGDLCARVDGAESR